MTKQDIASQLHGFLPQVHKLISTSD